MTAKLARLEKPRLWYSDSGLYHAAYLLAIDQKLRWPTKRQEPCCQATKVQHRDVQPLPCIGRSVVNVQPVALVTTQVKQVTWQEFPSILTKPYQVQAEPQRHQRLEVVGLPHALYHHHSRLLMLMLAC